MLGIHCQGGQMEGPRAPAPQEYADVLKFLDQSLRPNSKWSISSEYPTALTQQNLNNIRIIKEGEQVLSHAVIRPLIVKSPAVIFKVAAVGSVITNSEFRNRGLSAKIIEECLAEGLQQNCDIAILWSNLFDFYRKFGFELAGSEHSILIEEPLTRSPLQLSVREGANVDPTLIHRIYSKHTVSSVRTVEEIQKFLKIPNSRIYTAWDSTGQMVAYAVEGKGADLDGYIHEWGGGVNEIFHLVGHIYEKQKRNLTLIAPSHAVNLIQRFREIGCPIHDGHLGMIKLLNHENLFQKISKHVKSDLGFTQFVLEKIGDEYRVGSKNQIYATTSEREMVSFLFGPRPPTDIHSFEPSLGNTLNQIFPLRLWFWGWDSV